MAAGLKRIRVTKVQIPAGEEALITPSAAPETRDEAARRYLEALFLAPALESMSLTPETTSPPPELELLSESVEPLTNTVRVSYQQRFKNLPVFGARVGVELSKTNAFIAVDGSLASLEGLDTTPKLTPAAAKAQLTSLLGDRLVGPAPTPTLAIRFAKDAWVLCYLFEDVLVRAAAETKESERETLSERAYRFFLDANTGAEVLRTPLTRHAGPVNATGRDFTGRDHNFGAMQLPDDTFVLHDSERNIRTLSLSFASWKKLPTALPGKSIGSTSATFTHAGAVAAHAHAAAVLDFYRTVLQRNGIDGNGMEILSAVDCVDSMIPGTKKWRNAVWLRMTHPQLPVEVARGMMLYGQVDRPNGALVSIAEGLEVVAHELTHGITNYTSDLEYNTQSGAMNESYSDILGAAVLNHGKPIAEWSWDFGGILNANGQAIRNLEDPAKHGQPAHMDDFLGLPPSQVPDENNDQGHVHGNSGIHNKAAHLLFTSGAFTPEEVVKMFYLTLTTPGRMNPTSDFEDSLNGMLASCESLFQNEPTGALAPRLDAIKAAFAGVGISAL